MIIYKETKFRMKKSLSAFGVMAKNGSSSIWLNISLKDGELGSREETTRDVLQSVLLLLLLERQDAADELLDLTDETYEQQGVEDVAKILRICYKRVTMALRYCYNTFDNTNETWL